MKAVSRALKEIPLVNSSFDEAAGEVVLHDKYHVGVAVAAPQGLLVPVVKDTDKKDVISVAADIERLSNDAKTGKSKLDDLRGGTFTVTAAQNYSGPTVVNSGVLKLQAVGTSLQWTAGGVYALSAGASAGAVPLTNWNVVTTPNANTLATNSSVKKNT